MENYKQKLQFRIILLSVPVICATIIGSYHIFFASEAVRTSEIFGFQLGLISALGAVSLLQLLWYQKALQSKTKLQKLYNREHDERMKAIRAKAGLPLTGISSAFMIAAAILIGSSNIIVFYTLVTAAVCQMLLACIVKLACMKLM